MTSFGDVNVGDKVRLTHNEKTYIRHEFIATESTANLSGNHRFVSDEVGWSYFDDLWSVEVLEPAPKPLPTVPGVYQDSEGFLYRLYPDGAWCDLRPEVTVMESVDLVAVVPSTAVEEARAEVVKEIVAYARASEPSMLSADFIERKFLGGKA